MFLSMPPDATATGFGMSPRPALIQNRLLNLGLALILSLVAPAGLEARQPTVSDLFALPNLGNVRISPSGEKVAYIVTRANLDTNDYDRTIWVLDAGGGEPRRLRPANQDLSGLAFNPKLQWSPDGEWLSFIGNTSSGLQLFRMPRDGGPAEQISRSLTAIISYRWSHNGSKLAWLAAAPEPTDVRSQIEEKTWIRSSGAPSQPGMIWVFTPGEHKARSITPPAHHVSGFDWSPDGQSLVYAAASGADFMSTYNTRLFLTSSEGGSNRLLVDGPGFNGSPRWSPQGDWIAYLSNWGDQSIMTNNGIALVRAQGGDPVALTRERDRAVNELEWKKDGSGLFALASGGLEHKGAMRQAMFESQLYEINIDPANETNESIDIRALTRGPHQVYSLSINEAGDRMAYKISHGRSMGDVFVRQVSTGLETQITDLHPQMREIQWAPVEPVSWRSDDGMELWGLLARAETNVPAKPSPLLVYVHGGPVGGFAYGIYPQFTHTMSQVGPYPVQALAAAGIAVFMPMPRGGNGYGSAGLKAIINNWGVVDFRDIMSGVDTLVEQGIADPERLGVAGGSYGGYMTNWIVTQTGRFRAASSWAGVCDLATLYALSDAGDFTLAYFGTPWENAEAYRRHSPITYLSGMNTPLLIQHGESDNRVPASESIRCHKILAAQGKPALLEIYPRAGHVPFEPRMQLRLQDRNLQWFKQQLLGAE
jgi:dipeptidyl aminopeptidase/acylaminoacyl peptidase